MPTRDTAPTGAPCWIDLMTSDPAKSREFYCRLFGWEAEEPAEEFHGYFNFRHNGVRVAGCMGNPNPAELPDTWSVYLASEDARKTAAAAEAHGSQIIVPAMDVADLGVMAVVTDPGGAGIGVWQPGAHPGFTTYGEPGTPAWFEVHTRQYPATVAFYRDVFGWQTHSVSDTPEFRYTTLRHGEEWLAGIMDASNWPDACPRWSIYFGVAETDAALAKAVELGASVVQPAEDTPYGRLAAATDPTGTLFKLVGPNQAMPG